MFCFRRMSRAISVPSRRGDTTVTRDTGMNNQLIAKFALLVSSCLFAGTQAAAADTNPGTATQNLTPDPALAKVVADPNRSAKYVARDRYRHPVEELTFFGLKPNMTVLEVWPG